MRIQTILNRLFKCKGFTFGKIVFAKYQGKDALKITILPKARSRGLCSKCGKPAPCYATSKSPREFHFIPFWGILTFLLYRMRRVDCVEHGVVIERVPWADGKNHMTNIYMLFLATWAKRMSWAEVSRCFYTTWQNVFRSVQHVVEYGLAHRSLEGIKAIGIDEILWKRPYKFLTVVYQLDHGVRRLLWIGRDRKAKTLLRFFRMFGKTRSKALRYICSDMWKGYVKVIRKKAAQAMHIIDRFHLVANLNKALDRVRASEARNATRKGWRAALKHTRWCFLKREENLNDKQQLKLAEVLKFDMKSVRAYLLKESLQVLWEYKYAASAGKFLDRWVTRVRRSRLRPMRVVAEQFARYRNEILNWFRADKAFSCGIVEAFNNRIKLVMRKACGFRTYDAIEMALYHNLGALPEPVVAHRFW